MRARLTLAVALAVGTIALAAAVIAPRVVRASLIDDRLDAQAELERSSVAGFWLIGDLDRLDSAALTALIGPDVARLAAELDDVGALEPVRRLDDDGDLHVLAGPDVVATVGDDGRVRIEPLDQLALESPVISVDRLERIAVDAGVFGTFGLPLERGGGLEDLLEGAFSDIILELDELLDPSVFEELPGFEIGDDTFPPGFVDDVLQQLSELPDVDTRPAQQTAAPGETTVGLRTVDGRPRVVTASLDGIDESVDRVRTLLWIGLPITVLAAAMLTWVLAGRSLRPVAAITERTRRIRSSTLHERVPVPSSADEIAALATEMNTMLDRVQQEDERRRRFVSDASHELRSPIASMRAQAEAALEGDDPELAAGVLAEAERMGTLVDDLLALARHDEQTAPPGQTVDLDDIVYAEAARPRRVPVDVTAVSAGQVHGRPDELTRVVSHLIDNAARHADEQVVVSLTTEPRGNGTGVLLVVDDDGPGIAPADRAQVLERFVRLDDARTRDAGGSGLGLAVVDAVVRSAGGSIEIGDSPSGGARFSVRLPIDRSDAD